MSFQSCPKCAHKFSAKLSQCPACGEPCAIAAPPFADRGGSRGGHRPTEYALLPQCQVQGCRQSSVCCTRTGGWLCDYHYRREHLPAAQEYARKHGLVTVKDHIAHCKALAASFARKRITNEPVIREREPGED